ncbi:MAG: sigma-70 family RNA polymerase sigma factor [Actinobacteria bacterium]|nr:sigma-70 family RNA polymerase sigma factor [Actinomycetota bacterium]
MEPGSPELPEEDYPLSSPEPQLEFELFFRRAYPQLVQGLSVSWGPEVAADVVQEAFIRAHRRWKKISQYDDPKAWVRRVAVNLLVDDHRRRRYERRAMALNGSAWVPSPEDGYAPDVAAAVASLPERQRLIVGLYYLLDLPVAEVAVLTRLAEGTVKSALHDARKVLKTRLQVINDE